MRKAFRGVKRGRTCRTDGCDAKVEAGAAYCRTHARTPEAIAFRRELQSAGAYLELAAEALDPDQVERAESFHRFRQRAKHGQFDRLLEVPTKRMLDQAAAIKGFEIEIGALRFGLMRVLAEETDPTRLALALARLSNAGVRARQANADVEEERGEETEAEWLDRVSEAMLGFTLSGEDFAPSQIAQRAARRQHATRDRWEEARRAKAAREDAAAAAEAERRRQVEEESERRGWGIPVWGDRPGLAPVRYRPRDAAADQNVVQPSAPSLDADDEDEEDRLDAALALRIAEQRAEAVRRAERDREMSAYAVAGLDRDSDPEPHHRLARGRH